MVTLYPDFPNQTPPWRMQPHEMPKQPRQEKIALNQMTQFEQNSLARAKERKHQPTRNAEEAKTTSIVEVTEGASPLASLWKS